MSKSGVFFGQIFVRRIPRTAALAERARLQWFPPGRFHIGALALEVIVDRPPERRIRNVVRRIGDVRQVAAGELMLAPGAGLDAGELAGDGVFDRLVIADLEMQERMVLDRAPMAAE